MVPGRGHLGFGVLFALPRSGWGSMARAGSPQELEGPTGHRGGGQGAGSNFQKGHGGRSLLPSWKEVGEKLQQTLWRFVKFPVFWDIKRLNSLLPMACEFQEMKGTGPKVSHEHLISVTKQRRTPSVCTEAGTSDTSLLLGSVRVCACACVSGAHRGGGTN